MFEMQRKKGKREAFKLINVFFMGIPTIPYKIKEVVSILQIADFWNRTYVNHLDWCNLCPKEAFYTRSYHAKNKKKLYLNRLAAKNRKL